MKHKKFNEVYAYGYYLVRKSDNTKYVGVRYANVKKNLTPENDFGRAYFTSGKLKKEFKNNPENFTFRICYTFDTLEEMFEWERKIVMRVYHKPDWANEGWSTNFGDNPEIGKLISEGKNKIDVSGKSSIERGSETLKDWIWNTEDGKKWREDISKRRKEDWESLTEEERSKISLKRKDSMDFYESARKASETMKIVGEDGITTLQRKARKAVQTMREKGTLSKLAKSRNTKFNIKLSEMSDEEFEIFCVGRKPCTVNSWITRRKRALLGQY